MMKSEFIERTGFEPTLEEYREIEAEYMAAPEDVDKDTFCKQWKKRGGAERLMRLRARKIEGLEATIRTNERKANEREAKACERQQKLETKILQLERERDANAYEYCQKLEKRIRELELEQEATVRHYEDQFESARKIYKETEQRALEAEAKLETIRKALAALQ